MPCQMRDTFTYDIDLSDEFKEAFKVQNRLP